MQQAFKASAHPQGGSFPAALEQFCPLDAINLQHGGAMGRALK